MYCPSCGNEISVELRYCNRCGANLTVPTIQASGLPPAPVKLAVPSIVLGMTIVGGLGIIFGGASQFAITGLHPAAIVWMVLFSTATLFGCVAMMIRFWTKLISMQRETYVPQAQNRPVIADRQSAPQLPPRLEPVASVTENTTRTFTPIYQEPPDRGTR